MTTVNIPKRKLSGDWFYACKCNMPYPCIFAQDPTYRDCDGVLAYHINTDNYGNIILNGLNVRLYEVLKVISGHGIQKQVFQCSLMSELIDINERC